MLWQSVDLFSGEMDELEVGAVIQDSLHPDPENKRELREWGSLQRREKEGEVSILTLHSQELFYCFLSNLQGRFGIQKANS